MLSVQVSLQASTAFTMTSDADSNANAPVILRRATVSDLACIVDFNRKMAKVRPVCTIRLNKPRRGQVVSTTCDLFRQAAVTDHGPPLS